MHTKSIVLSFITISAIALLNGCGGSSESSGTTDSTTTGGTFEASSTSIPHTNQTECFDSNGNSVGCTRSGQDGAYLNNTPSYTNNGDRTVTDHISSLMWQDSADIDGDGTIDADDKLTQSEAVSYCENLTQAGYSDWRLPDIKTMYSLIDFSGQDVSGYDDTDTSGLNPFIDTDVFEFGYGDTTAGERIIDAQWASTSLYVADTGKMFGVNLADGRIKGYDLNFFNGDKTFYVQCVRENSAYGINGFINNGDETVTDEATALMWQKNDNGEAGDWDNAIAYCETLTLADHSDWRLPNVKELQSIVDYTKSPDTSNSAAIDTAYFNATKIVNEAGQDDYGFYWSGTTHENMVNGKSGAYVAFGRALGYMDNAWVDIHGAGAQRSDPKSLNISTLDAAYTIVVDENGNDAITHGPQGDIVRGVNFARCVRSVN